MNAILRIATIACLTVCHEGKAEEFSSEFIRVHSEGAGRDVVLVPGFACPPEVWSDLAQAMKAHCRLHLVHVAGFAGSPAPKEIPEQYLNTLSAEIARYGRVGNLEKPVFIGHSLGGFLSLLVAAREPTLPGGVIIVDALPFFSLLFRPSATAEQVFPQALLMETQVLSLDETGFARQAKLSVARFSKNEARRRQLLDWSVASDRKIYARALREILAFDARPFLKSLASPVWVIHAHDGGMGMSKESLGELYAAAYADLEGAIIRRVDGSFHFIMWDQSQELNRLIGEALEMFPAPARQ